ncbi:hypothetical protein G6O69_38030 [Pseudenhygromyxa sp. WMMC2535]|uniref:hypothetical protein n=1 Tax=Pseudenhygromyxa sp. WMMC2535 TaxID=2712867 RepID=UPI0015565DE0|nr:hypothetical protein [Pseudenhygromyxa sp. WMMC2535]NVB38222.1 hypothetical protein [Pseudenhygromyxa sp. WMMC2535]NVB41621.1 hypothetical protein [Pseudenhygromyxa sp. WMMC2535]NVB43645.1 hypothetical protein [Pseudenhygromyxa sp. WMMC2535]NVB43670.1 hypothetical protein [Pseudenhygromyxa sp. WMMC2535]
MMSLHQYLVTPKSAAPDTEQLVNRKYVWWQHAHVPEVQRKNLSLLLLTSSVLLPACGGAFGGGDDEAGSLIEQVCSTDCNHPEQCLLQTKDDPGPDDWEVVFLCGFHL